MLLFGDGQVAVRITKAFRFSRQELVNTIYFLLDSPLKSRREYLHDLSASMITDLF
jgi:hypothetical protein